MSTWATILMARSPGAKRMRNGLRSARGEPRVASRRVVPEQFAPDRLGDRAPAQHRLDGLRKPTFRVWVVRGEHQRIFAERLDGVAQRLLALVELDALEVLRSADVFAGLARQRRQGVPGHLGELVEPRGPGRPRGPAPSPSRAPPGPTLLSACIRRLTREVALADQARRRL